MCAAAGLIQSLRLSKRVRQLELLISAVNFIASEIRYAAMPVPDILRRLARSPEFGELQLFEVCAGQLQNCPDIRESWRRAVEEVKPKLSLKPGDYDALEHFGETFGGTDVEGQTANCESCVRLLEPRLDEAREDARKRGRMYFSLGLLAGGFAVVVLI